MNDWDELNVGVFVDQWQAFGRRRMSLIRSPDPPAENIRCIEQKAAVEAIFDGRGSQDRIVLRYLTTEAAAIDNGHTLLLDDGRQCRVVDLSRDGVETSLIVRVVS